MGLSYDVAPFTGLRFGRRGKNGCQTLDQLLGKCSLMTVEYEVHKSGYATKNILQSLDDFHISLSSRTNAPKRSRTVKEYVEEDIFLEKCLRASP